MTVRPIARHLLVAFLLGLAACGGGDGSEDTADDELAPPPDPMEMLAEPTAGQGVAVIGIEELSFTVTACTQGPRPDDTPEATLDYLVEGEGESSDGPFQVSISRYHSETGVGDAVVTETVRISVDEGGEARGVEAKRATGGAGSSDGVWLDLADADADGPLIERKGDAYDARGTFGPEGAREGDDTLESGRLRARCPAE